MMSTALFTSDDIFLVGNIAGRAIKAGRGDEAQMILRFLQVERPQNAGPHLLHATYLHAAGQIDDAIEYLEDANVFLAQQNGAETFIFFLEMLLEKGDSKRIYREVREFQMNCRDIPAEISNRIEEILASMN